MLSTRYPGACRAERRARPRNRRARDSPTDSCTPEASLDPGRVDMCECGVVWSTLAPAGSIRGSPTPSVSFHLCRLRLFHSTSPLKSMLCLIPP